MGWMGPSDGTATAPHMPEVVNVQVRKTADGETGPARSAPVAWVPQRPHLFAASVADNVRLGRPDAGRAEVRCAS